METVKQKFMRLYAGQIRIHNLEHMRSFPLIGYCSIDMVGGHALKGCIGGDRYDLLADALTRLREMDAEIIRRRLYLRLITFLSKMDLGGLEGECISILRMPRPEGAKVPKPVLQHNSLLHI
ncbi:hypothetical protein QO002_001131 [Pararhizobium capsulatum DSM 1112]|uniref:Uncharacterized protein n=1 Tax=Pararhizobium capsulatum DSM 1112 TaxID=1121113 RepID=A0ABU0BL66_9HYPH|nr:hypothetical protein [Pararhizobium capsulatum]MDQ0318993.1 hypothetical protein [Pararhizobium capsulatum DSM 1112]